MDISGMLSNGAQEGGAAPDGGRQGHSYPRRNTNTAQDHTGFVMPYSPNVQRGMRANNYAAAIGYGRGSPAKKDQKHVVFQLIDHEDPRVQARLPMRVMISTHDTTTSIIETVKNFYGLYDHGVSFENHEGISIIAAYDNFENDMRVHVRTVPQPASASKEQHARDSASPKKPSLGAPFMLQPSPGRSPSRTAARSAGVRSMSPQPEMGPRSMSAVPGGKPRPQRTKSKDNSVMGDADGYSSGDNGGGSVTSSRRSKTELVNAEISVDNIVEGGRRKGAFESSQLPLFVPPQVPVSASMSSVSPQRRNGPPAAASPYGTGNQQTFSYQQPLPSPMSYGSGFNPAPPTSIGTGHSYPYNPPGRQLRGRSSASAYPAQRLSGGSGILPTPDPTNASAISDEDVALQLMRLGDPMAFSHGRTSTSTLDDALSGKAELASSDEEDSDEEDEEAANNLPSRPGHVQDVGPQRKKQRVMNELPSDGTSGSDDYEDRRDRNFLGSDGMNGTYEGLKKKLKGGRASLPGSSKAGKPRSLSMMKPKTKPSTFPKVPMSPSSMPAPSRKGSIASTLNFQHQLGTDEEDLSAKPRCQRCRKSKKGCDRQRPCGRCKDAGIGIEGCVSEDEGNGRKGRYGRHMGVPIKKGEEGYEEMDDSPVPPAGIPANGYFLAPALPDKSKKRKR